MNSPLHVMGSDFSQSSPGPQLPQAFFDNPEIHALYLHIPFCFHKCHYCDFYSIVDSPGPDDRQMLFLQRLLKELRDRAGQVRLRPHTVFIGGGTPTYLRLELWERLLEAFHDLHLLDQIVEFTVEANPETVTQPLMNLLAQGGVTRISMGAQSFDKQLLKTLERWHDPQSVALATRQARQAGLENLNLDLIFAIPGQTMVQLEADLEALVALAPEHVSCYSLTYEPGTALLEKRRQGRIQPLDEALEKTMYLRVMERLAQAGYEQYEISNWAKPGRRCQHNLHYWTNDQWLGLGPAAASHVRGWRWKNAPHLGRYLDSRGEPPIVDVEHLSPPRRIGETLMLGLRLRQGVALSWLAENLPRDDPRQKVLEELLQLDMLERAPARAPTHLRLTPRGLLVADAVIVKLL